MIGGALSGERSSASARAIAVEYVMIRAKRCFTRRRGDTSRGAAALQRYALLRLYFILRHASQLFTLY